MMVNPTYIGDGQAPLDIAHNDEVVDSWISILIKVFNQLLFILII